ncbi:MAG: CopG family transcriptional regulator [Methanobacteriota archaeon]|nr:MAG: CopG family transcriptional regulator [Euryarchaeota archaeon]
MRLISIQLPEAYIISLEELVSKGMYPNRSEAIRYAIRDLLKRELWSKEGKNNQLRAKTWLRR